MDRNERESQENILRISHVVSKAFSLGKEHKTDEAYETLRPYLERDEVPAYFCQPAGWTIYRYVKEKMSELLPEQAKRIFGYYLSLCCHKPDMVHSYMMVLAMAYKKLHTQEFPFIDFCSSWDLDCFRDEDFVETKAKTPDGKPIVYQSLAVKAATLLYKDLKGLQSPEQSRRLLPFFDTVMRRCPGYEYTPLYIANLHAWSGDKETAIGMFKKMLAERQQWYLWKHLGDLMEDGLKSSCYCKALTLIDKEEYIGEIHLSLASLLTGSSPGQAAYELQAYFNTYQRNGWKIKSMAYEIKERLASVAASGDGRAFYRRHSAAAEDFVFGSFPQAEFVFTGVKTNANGKLRACLANAKKRLFVRMPPTPLLKKAHPGDLFSCRYNATKGHVALLTLLPTGKSVNIAGDKAPAAPSQRKEKEVEGKVAVMAGKPFAFLGHYYISPRLRQKFQLSDGQTIKAVAMEQQDGKWKIAKILSVR